MNAATLIGFILAALCAFIAVRQFCEKGFLLNNAYLWASKDERAKMDKKPYYRQSAVVFSLLCAVFIVTGLSAALGNKALMWLELPLLAGLVIYAVVSEIKIRKHEH